MTEEEKYCKDCKWFLIPGGDNNPEGWTLDTEYHFGCGHPKSGPKNDLVFGRKTAIHAEELRKPEALCGTYAILFEPREAK